MKLAFRGAGACGSRDRFYVEEPSYSALVMRNWRSANGLSHANSRGGETKAYTGPEPCIKRMEFRTIYNAP